MNDYLCAVLLNETYKPTGKYNDLGCGDTSKIPKARICWLIVRAFLMYKFRYSFSGNRIKSPIASPTHKEGSQQSFADIKTNNLLNHRTGCFKTHLPTMSQSRKLKLNGGKYGGKLSLGGRGFLSTFPLPASNLNLTKVSIKTTN